ncbi:MAG: pantetheine-phosphate adenylyltransferase [Candidatus Bathyarchaeia archaeon]|nr:pantetheine-phosphate adenylyltransferase [Candidatus Bathyarchaeota archaeon]
MRMKKRKLVAVGGTFDKLHKGHKKLLEFSFEIGEKVLIGLSSDELVEKLQKPHEVASYEERKRNLISFLNEKGFTNRFELIQLKDRYGVTLIHPELEALVTGEENKAIVEKINEERVKKGLKPLEIFYIKPVLAENNKPISSTRIRKGEINEDGKLQKF